MMSDPLRIPREKIVEALQLLGLQDIDRIMLVEIHARRGIRVVRYRVDPEYGARIRVGDTIATEQVDIAVEEPPKLTALGPKVTFDGTDLSGHFLAVRPDEGSLG